jgi:hypothetical protein
LWSFYQLATGGSPMTEGRHYWEVEHTSVDASQIVFLVGAVRPGLDHDKNHMYGNDAYYIAGYDGALYGNGKSRADPQGMFAAGDRIGVLLDLDAGWMRYYRNGKRCGPGYTEGVTGPLVRAAQLFRGAKVTVLPGAVAPEGAGDEGEFVAVVDYASHSLARSSRACAGRRGCPWAARRRCCGRGSRPPPHLRSESLYGSSKGCASFYCCRWGWKD